MTEALAVSQVALWLVVLALGATVLALARQIGVLHERVAPLGALLTDRAADVGDKAPRFEIADVAGRKVRLGGGGGSGTRSQLLLFVSPDCPVCKKLLPVARSFARSERRQLDLVLVGDGDRDAHAAMAREHGLEGVPLVVSPAVGMGYGVGKLPYAVLVDGEGTVRAKGLVNSREHLESLLAAQEAGVASLQEFLVRRQEGRAPAAKANGQSVH
jgi:methylamine dehydrogenase accessory protein MauD